MPAIKEQRLTRDQQRARYAYQQVDALRNSRAANDENAQKKCDDYKIAVKALGANILRSGLSAALADLMRRNASDVLDDLAKADIPGLGVDAGALFKTVNNLSVGEYMLATRETLQVVMWLKRACDALLNFDATADVKAAAE
jgi:CRISPR-associated protein Cmr5